MIHPLTDTNIKNYHPIIKTVYVMGTF